MKFTNKKTGETVEAKTYAEIFAFSHNSFYEKCEKGAKPSKVKNEKNVEEEKSEEIITNDGEEIITD